jgi:hypothetical protein
MPTIICQQSLQGVSCSSLEEQYRYFQDFEVTPGEKVTEKVVVKNETDHNLSVALTVPKQQNNIVLNGDLTQLSPGRNTPTIPSHSEALFALSLTVAESTNNNAQKIVFTPRFSLTFTTDATGEASTYASTPEVLGTQISTESPSLLSLLYLAIFLIVLLGFVFRAFILRRYKKHSRAV